MKRYLKTFVFIVLINQGLVFSQDSSRSVVTQSKSQPKVAVNQNFKVKSPSKAFWISIGSTVIPVGTGALIATLGPKHNASSETRSYGGLILALAGLEIGPSIGNFYAGNQQRGMIGLLVRGAGFFIIYNGLKGYGEWDRIDDEDRTSGSGSYFDQMYLGMGIVLGGAIWDIATAPRSAREYNKKHGLSFSPVLDPIQRSAAIAISYRF